MQFTKLKDAVARQFKMMGSHDLFRAAVNKDEIWECYLGSFPAGTNPIYRERTEHDCSCCKQFIRAVGSVVAVIDGKLVSVWDVNVGDETYQVVADAMASLVKSRSIDNVFLTTERTAGTDKSFEDAVGGVKTWEHFFVNIPAGGRGGEKNFVAGKKDIGPRLGDARSLHDVLLRSLVELTDDAVDTALELISQNSLYRGEEHKFAVTEFKKLKKAAKGLSEGDLDAFVWSKIGSLPGSVSKIRNTSIGQLLIDLSAGHDMESAVGAFEAMVAPANYKRPTALVTKEMVKKARAKVEELGLTSALERRCANLADVSVNNILFANRDARSVMAEGDVFDDIATAAKTRSRKLDKVEEVSVEKFISDILPRATSVEVMVENTSSKQLGLTDRSGGSNRRKAIQVG